MNLIELGIEKGIIKFDEERNFITYIYQNKKRNYNNPEEKDHHEAWITKYEKKIRQSDKGAYVNFLGEVDQKQVRAAYPGDTWKKLGQIKKKYDPTNLFRLNQNIPPK